MRFINANRNHSVAFLSVVLMMFDAVVIFGNYVHVSACYYKEI